MPIALIIKSIFPEAVWWKESKNTNRNVLTNVLIELCENMQMYSRES